MALIFQFLDELKVLFAKDGICELVYGLVEKYKNCVDDEDSRAVLKMACDIIVLILTGGILFPI